MSPLAGFVRSSQKRARRKENERRVKSRRAKHGLQHSLERPHIETITDKSSQGQTCNYCGNPIIVGEVTKLAVVMGYLFHDECLHPLYIELKRIKEGAQTTPPMKLLTSQ